MSDLDVTDPTFVDDLVRSDCHVRQVARWLVNRFGYQVTVMPLKIRPNPSEMAEYADHGDLYIERVGRIEVKQRLLEFDSLDSYPYATVIVDVVHTWERANPRPAGYVITNKDVTCCLVVRHDTSESWTTAVRLDRAKGRTRRFLECPLALCRFYRIEAEPETA